MGNTGLLRREAKMTLLQPHLGERRHQELRNSPFWHSSLFNSQLVKEGEDFLLKKGTSKDSQGFAPYQNKPFCGPHNKKRGSYRKCPYGYVLSFPSKPSLVRFPLIQSEYKARQKDQALATCIQFHLSKNAIERVENVPNPHQRWRPVIHLIRLNTSLHVEKFKMEIPESIRTSLIPGEWVSSIDLSDPYLHIPIHPNSGKYRRFCHRSQVFQFISLPFGLATAPPPGLYNDCKGSEANGPLQRTQISTIPGRLADQVPVSGGSPSEHWAVVDLTQSLGWIINQEKSELEPT